MNQSPDFTLRKGEYGHVDGTDLSAVLFMNPTSLTVDSNHNLYLNDWFKLPGNDAGERINGSTKSKSDSVKPQYLHNVRKLSISDGTLTTLAGSYSREFTFLLKYSHIFIALLHSWRIRTAATFFY